MYVPVSAGEEARLFAAESLSDLAGRCGQFSGSFPTSPSETTAFQAFLTSHRASRVRCAALRAPLTPAPHDSPHKNRAKDNLPAAAFRAFWPAPTRAGPDCAHSAPARSQPRRPATIAEQPLAGESARPHSECRTPCVYPNARCPAGHDTASGRNIASSGLATVPAAIRSTCV